MQLDRPASLPTAARARGSYAAAMSREPSGRPPLAAARRAAIAELLRSAGSVSVTEVEARFGISPMTARRDLVELERQGIARRTHGGAVLPSISGHEDSFATRLGHASEAKALLAQAAVDLVAPEETIFLDSSTTAYFVARRLVERAQSVTIITNSLPIMDVVDNAESRAVELIAVGGTLRRVTRSFVGPSAVGTVRRHYADRMFMSVKAVAQGGVVTDADELEAELKRAMLEHASEAVLLLDSSKLAARGQSVIAHVRDFSQVLTEGVEDDALAPFRALGAVASRVEDLGSR
jgi:DeoR/GlpR family transcriptional regulator of sugar metabolism